MIQANENTDCECMFTNVDVNVNETSMISLLFASDTGDSSHMHGRATVKVNHGYIRMYTSRCWYACYYG